MEQAIQAPVEPTGTLSFGEAKTRAKMTRWVQRLIDALYLFAFVMAAALAMAAVSIAAPFAFALSLLGGVFRRSRAPGAWRPIRAA